MLIGPGGAVSNLITTKVKLQTALHSSTIKLGPLSNLITTKKLQTALQSLTIKSTKKMARWPAKRSLAPPGSSLYELAYTIFAVYIN